MVPRLAADKQLGAAMSDDHSNANVCYSNLQGILPAMRWLSAGESTETKLGAGRHRKLPKLERDPDRSTAMKDGEQRPCWLMLK